MAAYICNNTPSYSEDLSMDIPSLWYLILSNSIPLVLKLIKHYFILQVTQMRMYIFYYSKHAYCYLNLYSFVLFNMLFQIVILGELEENVKQFVVIQITERIVNSFVIVARWTAIQLMDVKETVRYFFYLCYIIGKLDKTILPILFHNW